VYALGLSDHVTASDRVASPNQPAGAAYLQLILLGALIGVPAAFVSALFLAFVHYLQHWLWVDLPSGLEASSPPWYLVVGLPLAGACIVLVARRFLPGDGGHSPLGGLSSEPTPIAHGPGVAVAAAGTLGFGAVLGPEAPVIALGSVVGTTLAGFVRLGQQGRAVLSSAGSFSAISALFGGPIVAGMLLVEGGIGMGAALLPALVPGLVAAAVGYLIFIGFGNWGGLDSPGLTVPGLPAYEGTHLRDLVVALAVGFATALLVVAVNRLARQVNGLGGQRLGVTWLLLAGGLAVGILAELADLLGADSQDVLFSGQASVPDVVAEDSTKIVLVVLVAKAVAYAVSLGCGFRGGPIFPAIFLSIGLASLPVVWFDVSPTLAIAVGAAAGTAAQTRLLFTPLILSALLVGRSGIDAVSAAVLATVAAWLTVAALDKRAG
jgi:chloride channel protein, CIC family